MGRKERFYFGAAILFAGLGFTLAMLKMEALLGFAAVLTPICGGLYGGALGKLWIEKRANGGGK